MGGKKNKRRSLLRHDGGATFLTAIILLVVSTMIVIFAADIGNLKTKAVANQERAKQAYSAAAAGMEYGIVYLNTNYTTITASPSSGYINYTTGAITNVTLANGARYSITYTNPVANNYDLIRITSAGSSSDGLATRTIRQVVRSRSIVTDYGNNPLLTKGNVSLSGSTEIENHETSETIQSGGTTTISGSALTDVGGGGGSSAGSIGPDITQNDTTLSGMSNSDLFKSYFGTTDMTTVKAMATNSYSNSSNTNYSSTLNGMTGKFIWIDQTGGTTATINGSTTIGSSSNPVLMVINGNFSVSGNVTIYGFIYIIGSSGIDSITGNVNIIGGMVSTGNITMTGSTHLTYDTTVLNNMQTNTSRSSFAKVPGSWVDF